MTTRPDPRRRRERGRELETLPAKRGYTIVYDPENRDAWMQVPESLLVEVGGDV